ncbi:MAG TPA: isoprenyl transferase [Gemmatimonadota bacterium]|nr:isoprenyl transferase [Gemmatimonadota bacterium]
MTPLEDRAHAIRAQGNLPRHVAVIMDGNGRWAERRGQPRIFGHRAGMKSVRAVIEAAGDLGIEALTLYAFSKENWRRPAPEVQALMGLLRRYMKSEREELIRRGARVEAIGDLDQLEPSAREELDRLIEATSGCERLRVTLALSYGGRAEIVAAARRIARAAVAGELDPDALDEAGFARFLYSPHLPDPDLLVRTSGEMRISNFLLWQIAYAELYVTETLWPDFDRAAFFEAIEDYQSRERRFGKVMA